MSKISVVYKPEVTTIPVLIGIDEIHWACGKVNCDCDEQTEALMEERRYQDDCY